MGTDSGTDSAKTAEITAELDELITVWNVLPQTTRDEVMDLVRSVEVQA